MARSSRQLILVAASLVTACSPTRDTQTEGTRSQSAGLISDQVHNNGVPGFFWLPPMVSATTYGGTFKPGLSPVVIIDQLPLGSRPPLATYTTTSDTFGATVKTDQVSHYMVNWDTKLFNLDPSVTYRIRVVLENFELGFADVDVVSSGSQLHNVATSEYIPLLDGRTLPIKFRIESDALRCVGVYCKALDQCHEAGVCDPFTGVCSNPTKADGVGCDDGDACTQTDTCQAGTCAGSSPVVCTALDHCHAAGICDPATGQCSQPGKPDGAACDDGNACTRTDTCQAGACVGANPVTCVALDVCHLVGSCDPVTGACVNPELNCDDGEACTVDGCAPPTGDFPGGCIHARSTVSACAETCLYDPQTNSTSCTPTSYDDVSIIGSFLAGSSFHPNEDVKVSVTLQAGAAHDAYPVEVILFPVTDPATADRGVGAVVASTGIPIAGAGSAEYWIDGHIPAGLAPGYYVLLVHQYPDGTFVGDASPDAAYDLTVVDPGLPVLDLPDYYPDQQALLVDSESTVDPQAPTLRRPTPFSGTIDVVARNNAVSQVPLTAYLSWNGATVPLQFWDPKQNQYVGTLILGGPGNEFQPDIPRSQHLELAVSETDAVTLRAQLAAGPVSTQVVFVVNADGAVAEAPCFPPLSGPAICSHSLSASAIVATAPPPAQSALAVTRAGKMLASVQSAATSPQPFTFEKSFTRFSENRYTGAGVTLEGKVQFSEAGVDSHVHVDFPVKLWSKTLHLQEVVIDASAHRESNAHVEFVFVQAGSIIYDSTAPLRIDAAVINQPLPFPAYSNGWGYSFTFWIYWVPVTLEVGVDLTIGLDANVNVESSPGATGGRLLVTAGPSATATGYAAAYVGLAGIGAGAEGTLTLVGAELVIAQSASFTVNDDTLHPGRQYLLGDLAENLHYEVDSLAGALDLFARWPNIDWCWHWWTVVPYPCGFSMVKKTLPICSWTGYHVGADLIRASVSGHRIDPTFCYGLDACAGRCGTLPIDDCGSQPSCADCGPDQACQANVCVEGPCVPRTCSSAQAQCGFIPSGCPGIPDVNCGDNCIAPDTCGGGGSPNQCGCASNTCSSVGAECGVIPSGCPGIPDIDCGRCSGYDSCGGGGVPNRCGCTPRDCSDQGLVCGPATDECGHSISCGTCRTGTYCCGEFCQPIGTECR